MRFLLAPVVMKMPLSALPRFRVPVMSVPMKLAWIMLVAELL